MIVTPETWNYDAIKLAEADTISFDTETTGLLESDRPFSVAMATKHTEFYFDNRVIPDRAIEDLMPVISGIAVRLQNAKFDMRMALNQGWCDTTSWGSIQDTEVLGRLVRNDHLAYGLAHQAKRYGYEKLGDAKDWLKKNKLKENEYNKIPMDIISTYAMRDARVTYDLIDKMEADLDPMSKPVWDMEQRLTPVCFKMERRGLLINRVYTEEARDEEKRLILEAKSQFHLATGQVHDNSKSQLIDVFTKAGEIIPKTKKGNDSLTDDILESFTSPIAKLVQKIRYHEKRLSTYYLAFLEYAGPDDVVHADIRQAGTRTGRFSYRDPNLQNLPKDEHSEDRYVVRGCFVPRPGYVFVAIDYSQQEYRLMLAYSKHRRMIEAVMNGTDVHQATADLVGITRSYAKTLNFAILYGAGADKIAGMLGISVAAAKALKDKYFNKLLEVEKLIDDVIRTGKGRGYVYNWFGRKLFINHPDFAYALPNHIMQGGGADICKLGMLACDSILSGFDAHMVLQVHDALYFEMKESDMKDLIPKLCKAMIDVFPGKNGMMMAVDVKWSRTSLAERDLQSWQS